MKIIRNKKKLFSDKEKSDSSAKTVAGVGLVAAGGKLIKDSNKEGEITGRVKLYHGTTKKNAKSIKENGFDSSKAKSKEAIIKSDRNQIYLSKDKSLADRTGIGRELKGEGKAETLKVSLPYNELKTKQDFKNPEYANASSYEDYVKKTGDKRTSKKVYDRMSGNKGSDTVILNDDISNKYIKGSNKYKKNSIKEVSKYAKENPKRFIKGAGKLATGVGAIAGGAKLVKDSEDGNSKDTVIGASSVGAGIYTAKKSLNNDKNKLEFKKEKGKIIKDKSSYKNMEGDLVMKTSKKRKLKIKDAYEEVKKQKPLLEKNSKKAKDRVDSIIKKSERNSKLKGVGKGVAVAVGGYTLGKKLLKKKNKLNKKDD